MESGVFKPWVSPPSARVPYGRRLREAWLRLWRKGEWPPSLRLAVAWIEVRHHDWVSARVAMPSPPAETGLPPRIHFFYSIFDEHFSYLLLSLTSLMRLQFPHMGRIYVYQNGLKPLTLRQEAQLRAIAGDRLVLRYFKGGFVGLCRIWRTLDAWEEIASEMGENDILAKCDSDVLWLRNAALERALGMEEDLLGHTCDSFIEMTGFVFSQGGLIFIRRPLLAKLPSLPVQEVIEEELPRLMPYYMPYTGYDDAVIYLLARSYGARLTLETLYLGSVEAAEEARGLESVIHYEGVLTKKKMLADGVQLLGAAVFYGQMCLESSASFWV